MKDDFLFISYHGKIAENGNWDKSDITAILESEEYDHIVWGSGILKVIKGAREYSGYDISNLIEQLKDKQQWVKENFPDDFNSQCKEFDTGAYFA